MIARLEIEDVWWQAGATQVLAGVSFAAGAGELVALMGRNGAGKSTLLDIAAALRRPRRGVVRLDARPIDLWDPRARARMVAHLPQAVRPDLPFLAIELVLMGRYPHTDRWFESDEDRVAVEQAMRRTGSWELRSRAVQSLSGGERQRVLLAACFAQRAPLLLFDEPSTYLDIDQQLHCFTLLREECDRGGTCLAVTHDLNLALTYATRIVAIAEGRVALDLPVGEAARRHDWLALFSDRLRLSVTPAGQPWVSYA
jgi:iron complex transport system ATP-binding protein